MKLELRKQKRINEALERAEKITKAKDNFFSNISHELKTPLNAINGKSCHSQLSFGKLLHKKLTKISFMIFKFGSMLSKLYCYIELNRKLERVLHYCLETLK